METGILDFSREIFVRFKGFYEGLHRGFYRNGYLESTYNIDECLGDASYDSLDLISGAIDKLIKGDWSINFLGINAFVRLILDNEKDCKFD